MAEAFAPAKVNLALHVIGQRSDGYHLLDSLVVFAGVGDTVCVEVGDRAFHVAGPRAHEVPTNDSNLVRCAARFMGDPDLAIRLEKHLPVASGIGGGSSDAAATLRAISYVTGRTIPEDSASLGADVPVCVAGVPARMRGIGDKLLPLPPLPPLWLVLVNPGMAVETPSVFAALSCRRNAPLPEDLPDWPDAPAFARWLEAQRNDLEHPARSLIPAIGVALSRISATKGCRVARMSGSGATCFGLFESAAEADSAAEALRRDHPHWWIVPAPVLSPEFSRSQRSRATT